MRSVAMNAVYENKSCPMYAETQRSLSPVPHLHKEVEIVYVRNGSCVAFADRSSFALRRGDLFLAFPNQIHYYEKAAVGTYYVLISSPDVFFGLGSEICNHVPVCNVLSVGEGSPVAGLVRRAVLAGGKYRMTALHGYMNLLMSAVFPLLTLKPLILSDNLTVHSVLDYCSHNCTRGITLDTAARDLHLSKYYISHVLNQQLHLRFNEYVNTLRIDAACDSLKETDKKIADISEDVGFGTIRSFNRSFKRLMNMTPKRYREMLRPDQPSEFR